MAIKRHAELKGTSDIYVLPGGALDVNGMFVFVFDKHDVHFHAYAF